MAWFMTKNVVAMPRLQETLYNSTPVLVTGYRSIVQPLAQGPSPTPVVHTLLIQMHCLICIDSSVTDTNSLRDNKSLKNHSCEE